MWLTASEALSRLGSKPQTLYANVSRGRIKAKPDPHDQRRSLYLAEDVERLAARAHGRRSARLVAAETVSWGEPVLASAISTVVDGRLYYRGVDAQELSRNASITDAAALLWGCEPFTLPAIPMTEAPSLEAAFLALAQRAAVEPPVAGQGALRLIESARDVLAVMGSTLAGAGEQPVEERLAELWQRREAAEPIRRTLILLADHELNASTFAARVAVSTGASLWAGALAGLSTLTGPYHGTAAREVQALAQDIGSSPDAEAALRDWLGEGRVVPGMGHRLYPEGDSRARTLLASFEEPPAFAAFRRAADTVAGELPSIDYALAAMCQRFELPSTAPVTLFAIGRSVGWLAHMMEQITTGTLIRPRARYAGPPIQPV